MPNMQYTSADNLNVIMCEKMLRCRRDNHRRPVHSLLPYWVCRRETFRKSVHPARPGGSTLKIFIITPRAVSSKELFCCPSQYVLTQICAATRFGGHGLWVISDVVLPAHHSWRCSSFTLYQEILGNTCEGSAHTADSLIDSVWSHPTPDNVDLHSSWDNLLCHIQVWELKPMLNQHHLPCFRADNMTLFSAWLNTVPSAAVRTLLD